MLQYVAPWRLHQFIQRANEKKTIWNIPHQRSEFLNKHLTEAQ